MSSIPNPEEVWMNSSVTEEELEKMVEDQVLPAKDLVGWRATNGELFPTANTEEIVVFTSFFYQGFALPTSSFFSSSPLFLRDSVGPPQPQLHSSNFYL